MFDLYLEETSLIYLKNLPATLQATALQDLDFIRRYGVTSILPENLHLLDNERFSIKSPVGYEDDTAGSIVLLRGHMQKGDEAGLYIHQIEGYIKDKHLGPIWRKPKSQEKYVLVGKEWLLEQIHKPFVEQAYKPGNRYCLDDGFSAAHTILKRVFFRNLAEIRAYKAHMDEFDSHAPFSANVKTEYVTLRDGELKSGSVREALARLKALEKGYIVVNFVDKADGFNFAQAGLMHNQTFFMTNVHKDTEIAILDVIVRDKDGNEFYEEDYRAYRESSPWPESRFPFSMVLFNPDYFYLNKGTVQQLRKGFYQTLYFDLFENCRNEELDEHEKDKLFHKNIDLTLHDTFSAINSASSYYWLQTKDLKGHSEREVQEAIQRLRKQAIVMRVNGDKAQLKKITEIANHLATLGYPYIHAVHADGNAKTIEIFGSLGSSLEVPADSPQDIFSATQVLYERFILYPLKGNHTSQNLFSGFDLNVKTSYDY